jgi:hypothetical protein
MEPSPPAAENEHDMDDIINNSYERSGITYISREHLANNVASSFHFGLEVHNALDEAKSVLAAQGRLLDSVDTSLQD